jgi:hypothetical protein
MEFGGYLSLRFSFSADTGEAVIHAVRSPGAGGDQLTAPGSPAGTSRP